MAFLLFPADSSLVCRSLVGPRGVRVSDWGWLSQPQCLGLDPIPRRPRAPDCA